MAPLEWKTQLLRRFFWGYCFMVGPIHELWRFRVIGAVYHLIEDANTVIL